METATTEQPLDDVLQRAAAGGVDVTGLREPLASFLQGDSVPLRKWARLRGIASASAASPLDRVVSEALSLARAVEPGDPDAHDKVAAFLVSPFVEGHQQAGRPQEAAPAPFENLRDRVAELTAFHRVISAANSSLKLSDMLHETAQAVVAVTHADICSIFLYEPERDQLVLTATSDASVDNVGHIRLQLGEGITGRAAMVGAPIAVRNAQSDPRFTGTSGTHADRAASILAVPVVLFTIEKLVGAITIRTFEERDFTENEIQFLETVAGEIAIAIENARLYEQTDAELRQKVAELTTLQGVSAHIASTLNLSEVLSLIAHQSAHLVHADATTIYALTAEGTSLEQVAQYDLRHPHHNIYEGKIGPRIALDVEMSAIAKAVLRGIPTSLPPDTDEALGLAVAREGYKSMFCVPLVAPRGIMGGICLYNRDERTFRDDQVHLLDAFAHEAAIALENARLHEAAVRGLQIKSTMLQEMNHRVRNNLQTVAGLLSMQLRRLPTDNDAATAIRESIGRIESMAAVHDLMVGRDVVSVTVSDLAHQVSEAAVSTLTKPDFKLKLVIERVEAESISVRSHEATLLALLLNELVSNAILHGFAGRKSGEIVVRAWATDANPDQTLGKPQPLVNISVEDNGIGLPAGFDSERSANLGLSLVRTLVVSDLRGTFSIRPRAVGKGTVAHIAFPRSRL